MAVTATPIFPQTIGNPSVQILPADTTTLKTVVTPGSQGTIVNRIFVTSTDTSAKDLAFYVTISAVDYLIGTLSIPANSGFTNAVPMVSVFNSSQFPGMLLDNNGNKVLFLGSGSVLKAKVLTTVTAAKAINIFAQTGDF